MRVCQSTGSCATSGVIAAINRVTADTRPNRIISMSLGGGKNTMVNDAVERATAAGVLVVAAAGNSNADACFFSPGRHKAHQHVASPDCSRHLDTCVVSGLQRGRQASSIAHCTAQRLKKVSHQVSNAYLVHQSVCMA